MIDFFRKFGFTQRDLILISLLLFTLAAGLIIKSAGWKNVRTFDYSSTDAEFEQHVNSAFSKIELNEEQKEKLNLLKQYSDSLLDEKEKNTTLKNGEIPSKKINLNRALIGDLLMLPGIGEVTAERIIEYREKRGEFKTAEDLMNVKGIGVKKFEKIRNLITVD
jgi:comEA protein